MEKEERKKKMMEKILSFLINRGTCSSLLRKEKKNDRVKRGTSMHLDLSFIVRIGDNFGFQLRQRIALVFLLSPER